MPKEKLATIKEFALRFILDPVTWTGNPQLCARVAKWANLSPKGQMHFQAMAHISQAAFARTYFGDELAVRRHYQQASSLINAANFIKEGKPSE